MNKKFKIGIVSFLLLIGICYVYFFKESQLVIPCIFHKLTGFFCPGCGITRCLNSLLHLDFYQAFRYNALVLLLIPVIICIKVIFYNKSLPNYIWYIILIIVLLFGVLRNIPYFEWLQPTII